MDDTLFISDLHAGSPLFKYRAYLTSLIEDSKYKNIVVVGDILDVWEDSLEDILNMNISVVEALRNSAKNIYIVKGNHDPSHYDLRLVFPNAVVVEKSMVIDDMVIVHGDEFDDLIIKYSSIATFLHHIHWVFERVGINLKAFFRNLFYSVSDKIGKDYYDTLVYDIMDKVITKYKNQGRVIITGHTHMPMIANHIDHRGIKYINCGDWVHNFSFVEFIDGNFTLTKLR